MPRPPTWITLAFLALSLLVGLSVVPRAYDAFTRTPPNWFLFGFEVVVLVSCLLSLHIARRLLPRRDPAAPTDGVQDGPAIAFLCVAGAVFVCSVLGYITAEGATRGYRAMLTHPITAGRLAAAAALAGLSALTVLLRAPRIAFRRVAIGLAFGVAAVGVGALFVVPQVGAAIRGVHGALVMVAALTGAVVLVGLVSASGHFLITAFEAGSARAPAPAAAKPATTVKPPQPAATPPVAV